VLFNPVVRLGAAAELKTPAQAANKQVANKGKQAGPLQGVDQQSVSPWRHVSKDDPPTIIFHGKADATVPYVTVEAFTEKMLAAGNRCELVGFDDQDHGFFNYNPAGNKYYDATLRQAEDFLASLGYLKGR